MSSVDNFWANRKEKEDFYALSRRWLIDQLVCAALETVLEARCCSSWADIVSTLFQQKKKFQIKSFSNMKDKSLSKRLFLSASRKYRGRKSK